MRKMLFRQTRLRRSLVVISYFVMVTYGYETYYVERNCTSGNFTIPLRQGGPLSAALLSATQRISYSFAMNCEVTVSAPNKHKVVVAIKELGFRSNLDGTCKDYIQIQKPMCEELYREDEERHFISTGNSMQMVYHTSKQGLDNSTFTGYTGMRLSVTAIMEGSACPAPDDADWFRCDNGHCIWSGFKCDSHNNCGDLSDEKDCGPSGGRSTTVLIILGALILFMLLIMCTATLLCSKNETVRRFSNRLRSRTLSYLPRIPR